MIRSITLKAIALASVTACATPQPALAAGEWRLNPRLCPDLVEDRIDRQIAVSRRDVREDIRDARRVNCPAFAWVYQSAAPVGTVVVPAYRGPTLVYVSSNGYYQYRTVRGRRARKPVRINLVVR
ncbi:MAG: hypothetical protein AAGJ50_00485 [Pseudomonadota bacterium]